jgi:hypothetical protein
MRGEVEAHSCRAFRSGGVDEQGDGVNANWLLWRGRSDERVAIFDAEPAKAQVGNGGRQFEFG